jgi:hypothetical protein
MEARNRHAGVGLLTYRPEPIVESTIRQSGRRGISVLRRKSEPAVMNQIFEAMRGHI